MLMNELPFREESLGVVRLPIRGTFDEAERYVNPVGESGNLANLVRIHAPRKNLYVRGREVVGQREFGEYDQISASLAGTFYRFNMKLQIGVYVACNASDLCGGYGKSRHCHLPYSKARPAFTDGASRLSSHFASPWEARNSFATSSTERLSTSTEALSFAMTASSSFADRPLRISASSGDPSRTSLRRTGVNA
ncbi:hypothetical protein D9M70_470430 [compost metagenome]